MHRVTAITVSILLLSATRLPAQDNLAKKYTRNIIWVTPVKKNTIINGVALGLLETGTWGKADYLRINGMNVDAGLFGAVATIYGMAGTVMAVFSNDSTSNSGVAFANKYVFPEEPKNIGTKINGISVSLGGLGSSIQMSGLSINGGSSFVDIMNGVEVSGFLNIHYAFNGIMISAIRNKVTTGRGLQVGLINTCKKGKLVQIGLINKIGKRVLPVMNLSL